MPRNRAVELGKTIAALTQQIEEHYLTRGMPYPSLENGEELSSTVNLSRQGVLDAIFELQRLMLGPRESLFLSARNNQATIQAVCDFDLARSFPVGGSISFIDMATVSGVDERNLRRIVRHAATEGIFRESPKGIIQHTPASKMLAQDETVRDFMDVCYREVFPAMQRTVCAIREWPQSQDPAQTGFSRSQPDSPAFFDYLAAHPDRARRFASAMATYSAGPENDVVHLCEGYPWQELGSAMVVDMGGSTGFVSLALAKRFHALNFIVQDKPEVVKDVFPPQGILTPQVKVMAHDLFSEQPCHGAATYLLRMVLHDFSDADCIQILRSLAPAMADGARVILNEFCLPEPGTVGWLEDKHVRTMDMNMLSLFNSRERDVEDWQRLFAEADSRWQWNGIIKPEGSNLAIMEIIWRSGPFSR